MTGAVDVGGGMRGIYGAGVFDFCIDHGISFDVCAGVSAGAANICSYAAGQRGRNYRFYTEYAFRREYMGLGNFLKKGSYIDLDYIYGTLSNSDGESPLDFEAILRSGISMQVVATDAVTGNPVYFRKEDMKKDWYDPIKASSCVPVANRPYFIDGVPYYDGGLSDPIPVNRVFREGCEKAVVILTRPRDAYRKPEKDVRFSRIIQGTYPKAAFRLAHRAGRYNSQLDLIKKYEARGKVLILAPENIGGMKTLKKDREAMERLYRDGYKDAEAICAFLQIQ